MVHSLERIRPVITNVKFTCRDYTELTPRNSLIYCDPPYRFDKFPIKYLTNQKEVHSINKYQKIYLQKNKILLQFQQ